MDWIMKTLKYLSSHRHEKTTVKFLIFCIVVWSGILYLIFRSLYQYIYEAIPSISKSTIITSSAIIWLIGVVIIPIIWLIARKTPKFKKNEIGILFAPHKANGECCPNIIDLFKRVKIDLLSREGVSNVICKKLPFNHIIKTNKDAHDLLGETKASIIIHGNFDTGNLNNKPVKGFFNISFTVSGLNLRALKDTEISFIISSIGPRQFTTSEENNFTDQNVVVNNINDISLYLISISFILSRNLSRAIEILEGLRERHILSDNKNIKRFLQGINAHLASCYDFEITKIYTNHLILNITQESVNSYARQFLDLTNKHLQVSQDNIAYQLRKAIYNFHFRDIEKAKNCLKIDIVDKSDIKYHLRNISLAFLHMWENKYKKSLQFYRKSSYWMKNISKDEQLKKITDDVIIFIESVLKFNPEKYYLYFSLGFICEHCNKEEKALSYYSSFLEKNNGIDNALRQYAERYLEKHRKVLSIS